MVSKVTRRGLLGGSALAVAGYGASTLIQDGDDQSAEQSPPELEDRSESEAVDFPTNDTSRIEESPAVGSGPSLRVQYPYGEHRGLSRLYELDSRPTELYSQYWIRYDEDFDPSGLDGEWGGPKQPGFRYPGSYGTDDPPDGTNGWSSKPNVTPDGGLSQYTWDMSVDEGEYGKQYHITDDFPFGEWVKLTQRLKLNNVTDDGDAYWDGVLQVWVNDDLELDKRDLRFSTAPEEQGIYGWLVFFFGGAEPSPQDQGLNFDEYVLSPDDVTDTESASEAARSGENAVVVF